MASAENSPWPAARSMMLIVGVKKPPHLFRVRVRVGARPGFTLRVRVRVRPHL